MSARSTLRIRSVLAWFMMLGLLGIGSTRAAERIVTLRHEVTIEEAIAVKQAFWPLRENTYIEGFLDDKEGYETYLWVAEVDLNDDGTPELLCLLEHSYFCGTGGCSYYIIQREGSGARVIGEGGGFPRLKIRILDRKDHGYHRIKSLDIMKWDGMRYQSIPSTHK